MRPNATTVRSGWPLGPQNRRRERRGRFERFVAGRQRRVAALAIQQLVLDDQRRLDAVAQRRDTARRCACGHAGRATRRPGMPDEVLLEILTVRRAVAASAAHRACGRRAALDTRPLYMPRNLAAWFRS